MGKTKVQKPPIVMAAKSKNPMGFLKRDWQLYVMLILPVALVIVFSYAAYPGLRMAFMDYKPAKGYDGSAWVGMSLHLVL